MLKKYIYILAAAIIGFTGCDIIDGDYLQTPDENQNTDTSGFGQNVLVEDFTGHLCGNCPYAAETIHEIAAQYSKPEPRVIVLGIHSGYYAQVTKDWPDDFRSAEATEIASKWDVKSNPIALINRREYKGSYLQYQQAWGEAVDDQLKNEALLKIKVEPSYEASTRTVKAKITVTYKGEIKPSHYLAVYIKESGIVGKQKDDRKTPNVVENYVFNNVFRTSMNSLWGEQLSATAGKPSAPIVKEVQYVIPADKTWVPENLTILAYVHDFEETWQIYQVNEAPLIKK